MTIITPSLVPNYSSNEELNSLLNQIDIKITQLANIECQNIVYGFTKNINYNLIEDLSTYKDILLVKLLGCNCLENQFLSMIVSKIKKLIK